MMLVVVCAVLWPAPARAEEKPVDGWCATAGLDKAEASASIRLRHGGRDHTKVTARLTVHVPSSWKLAPSLLLAEDSGGYRRAMGCLTRSDESQHRWWGEWRPRGSPRVTSEKGGHLVRFDTFSWIDEHEGWFALGPWRIERGTAHWRLRFTPAPGLHRVNWTRITVDPGEPGAESARPKPVAAEGATGLVWRPKGERKPPDVTVRLKPGWQRSFAAQDDRFLFANLSSGGNLAWTGIVSGLLLVAAFRLRRRAGAGATEAASARTLSDWAWISAGVVLVFDGDTVLLRWLYALGDEDLWIGREPRIALAAAVCAAVPLLAFGRQGRYITGAGAVLAAPVLAVACQPDLFGLPDDLDISGGTPEGAFFSLLTAAFCAQTLTFLGFTAAAWRLAGEGGLIPPGRAGTPRALLLRYAGPLALGVTAAVGACYTLATERNWQRVSWLSLRGEPAYGLGHRGELRSHLTWYTVNGQNWWLPVWVLTGLALYAVLRATGDRSAESPLAEPADRRVFLLFFPVVVGMSLGLFANNALLSPLWIFINTAALRLAASAGASRAVLGRGLDASGERLGLSVTAARRADILGRARRYREIHAKMRRLDQGQSDDDILQRRLLEQEIRGLHAWTGAGGGADRLPPQVSVVDVALSMGPRDTWWDNGRRAARFAFFVGLPASGLVVWSGWVRGDNWRASTYFGFGLPDAVSGFLAWQVCWAGAGFVLGALWRCLPGRRGPVRALPVAAAFALPAGVDALGNLYLDQGYGDVGLCVVAMLFVLTVTGIALDLDIFQDERRFWQSRFGLLLSVYQMRYFSLQLAYLVAQAVAMLTLWQFFTDTGGGPPPKEFESGGGGGGK
ncbi:DUF6185 family protein [Streptomyces alfalfae]|uniref:Uncharacterized protein n=1 Tax=Streptomyces alfalfae TaxID=1642299 RepID=A0A7T4U0T5_9ACTN|nr:DUF6185 family protein [Streptomyces alfalfae]QQC92133.1 hypothetical protein I8755_29840 [Streptomyces alfalfae]